MRPNSNTTVTARRRFLKQMGCLTVGLPLLNACGSLMAETLPEQKMPNSLGGHLGIDAWLEVLEDNRIRVFTGKVELGQGIRTVIQQVAAEELYAEMDMVEVVVADTNRTPNEGYTAGSGSVKDSAMSVRYAAATARHHLLMLAAEKMDVDSSQLALKNGLISAPNSPASVRISELLDGQQFDVEVTLPVPLVPKEDYRYVGKSIQRGDLEKIVRGTEYYIQDLRFEDMLHARVVRPPNYTAQLQDFDRGGFEKVVGTNIQVIQNGSFIACVGSDEYQVVKAQQQLTKHTTWTNGQALPVDQLTKNIIQARATDHKEVSKVGDIANARQNATVYKGTFFKPYIMHGAMGPACGIARYEGGQLQVWTNSQGIFPFREALGSMMDMDVSDIHVVGVAGAGAFGHNSSDDAAADAALIASALPGRHIRVQWSRDQEHRWEPMGTAMVANIEAGVSDAGKITFWKSEVWSDSHSVRPNAEGATLLAARYMDNSKVLEGRGYLGGGYRNAIPYYTVPNQDIQAHFFDGPIRVSSLRSLGAFANVFAIESIIDTMSIALDEDPITFRIRQLEDDRAIAVLSQLQQMIKKVEITEREGIGVSFSRYKNNDGYCAVAAHVSVGIDGAVQIIKMYAVLDAGEVMNTGGLINQTEGAMIQAASWTLKEAVQYDATHVTSNNWASYPIFRYQDIPEVEVFLMPQPNQPPFGGGEAGTPPTPAAITNAIYRATGQRIYDLPVSSELLTH